MGGVNTTKYDMRTALFESVSDCNFNIGSDSRIVPGFVDVHTHGVGGFEFEDASASDIESMLKSYASLGTLYLMPTLGTVELERLYTATDNITSAAIKTDGKDGYAKILGIHYECRYLSPKKAGAHDKSLLANPSTDEAASFLDKVESASQKLGRRLHVHFTIAPELDGGLEFIKYAVSRGATVGIGHSDADADMAVTALDAGATSFTHTFNAMRPIHHRDSSALTTALTSNAYAEIICDGRHIIPEVVKLYSLAKRPERAVLITDSVGAGIPEGEDFEFLSHKAKVCGGVAVQSDGTIAGSVISMADGFKNYVNFTGTSIENAVRAATSNPLEMVNSLELIAKRYESMQDFIVLDDKLQIEAIYTNGKKL